MRSHSASGFTLIEVVVATAIMATVIASIAHVVMVSAEQSSVSRRHLQVLVFLQSKLEQLRASTLPPDGGTDRVGNHVRRWSVTPLDSGAPPAVVIRVCADGVPMCVVAVRVARP